MSAPDHRPYLRPDVDLVTAEDVLAWLDREDDISGGPPLWYAIDRLRARLGRERRQACRRAALDRWRTASRMIRWCREASDGRVRHNADWAWADVGKSVWHSVYLALAFRAAARAR